MTMNSPIGEMPRIGRGVINRSEQDFTIRQPAGERGLFSRRSKHNGPFRRY